MAIRTPPHKYTLLRAEEPLIPILEGAESGENAYRFAIILNREIKVLNFNPQFPNYIFSF